MIKVALAGYGNIGKGTELAVMSNRDMALEAIFTRREPSSIPSTASGAKVLPYADIARYSDAVDVVINCGGSATDLPVTTPAIAQYCNVVDSFDTHAKIAQHYEKTDEQAKQSGHIAIISVGWDPGMFSLNRLYMNAILPDGSDYTFWGRGVSQGHSDAIRRIDGVADAKQYTVPVEAAVQSVLNGEQPELTAAQKHRRECYVVAQPGADKAEIERKIKTMPNYFADYDTSVEFVSAEELHDHHAAMPHAGRVIRTGYTGADREHRHTVEYSLRLDSNPEFTGSILAAYARAAYRLSQAGESGCRSVLDIAPSLLLTEDGDTLRRKFL